MEVWACDWRNAWAARYGVEDMLIEQVRHWLDGGGSVRLIRLTATTAEIELRACTGEIMDRLRAEDGAVLARLEAELAEPSGCPGA